LNQTYKFFDGGTIKFDDQRSVKDLIAYAFQSFDYCEPMGMDVVTIFQTHHPNSRTGWFTTDTSLRCAEEIKSPNELCFAYYSPNVFYFAEGGWGHGMTGLGNRPKIDNEVALNLRIDDSRNTVVINGKYTFKDVINFLKETEYIDRRCNYIEVCPIGCIEKSYTLPFKDPIMNMCLSDFEKELEKYTIERIHPDDIKHIYYIELCFADR